MEQSYVHMDQHGAYRVGGTRVMLDGVVSAYKEGCTPETIIQRYRALTLEHAYGAIAYYLANKELVEDYLRKQNEEWERLRAEQDRNPSPAMVRVRQAMKARQQASS